MLFKQILAKWYCPVTVTGCIYLSGAMGLLLLGRIRGELGAALAGLLLLSYALLSLFGCLVSIPFWAKSLVRVDQKTPGLFFLSTTNLPSRIIRFFCGARLYLLFSRVHAVHQAGLWHLAIPIEQKESRYSPASPGRGAFIIREHYLLLHDFTSFFSFRLYSPASNAIEKVLYPASPEPHVARGTVSGQTGRETGKSTFERSESLYETRAYLPGDDPRKINWKVYAHSGALSVREGELLPPPSAELYCIISTSRPNKIGNGARTVYTSLINRTAAFLLEHLENNKTLMLVLPDGTGAFRTLRVEPSSLGRDKILTEALADPELSSPEPDVETLARLVPRSATILVFSLPETPIFTLPGRTIHWFIGPYPARQEGRTMKDLLKSCLFISNDTFRIHHGLFPSTFEQFISRLEEKGFHAHIL